MLSGAPDFQVKKFLGSVQDSLDGLMERSIQANNPADLGAFKEVRNQYRNFLVLQKAATGASEAARAGQHGVGFSVVAGEVRKLAERSSQAAREISKLIDESTLHVNQGAQVTKAAASSFEGILAAVTRTGNSVSAIATATDAQRNMAEAVTSTIQQLEQLKGS